MSLPVELQEALNIASERAVLLREIYDKGYLNVNEPLRQRVLSCLFPTARGGKPAPDDPNAPFRWICIHCDTVSGIDDKTCLGCRKPRYPTLAANSGAGQARESAGDTEVKS